MILFIDRLPLYSWIHSPALAEVHRSVSLPVIVTAQPKTVPKVKPSYVQRWVFDPAFTGEAYAWRSHLLEAGLDPNTAQAGMSRSRSAFGDEARLPIRTAALWLVSNIPHLYEQPYPLPLQSGIVFRDVPAPDDEFHRPLLGMRLLMRAGLKVKIDFGRATVSVWIRGPWQQQLTATLHRCLSGFRTLPVQW